MEIFISLVIFSLGLVLFFITNNKIKKIKGEILIEETRRELEGLLTEFNGAAARNIELLESKIGELQDIIQKANGKMSDLDDKIGRANRPIVVEKYVDRPAQSGFRNISADLPKTEVPAKTVETVIPGQDKTSDRYEKTKSFQPKEEEKKPDRFSGRKEKNQKDNKTKNVKTTAKPEPFRKAEKEYPKPAANSKAQNTVKEQPAEKASAPVERTAPQIRTEPQTRSEQLKQYIQEGLTKQELIAKGFMENEINLLSFLIKKNF